MIKIERLSSKLGQTIGVMSIDDEPFFWTLEDIWDNNLPNKSCIPSGHYRASRYHSLKFGDCYKILDLQGREPANRSGILIHSGNTAKDTTGCILLGLELGYLKGDKAILKSQEAFHSFLGKMYGIESCELVIS